MTKNIRNAIFYCLSFLILWSLCISKIAPSSMAGDSPETTIAIYSLGIQHPPGYTIDNLLGKIFVLLPIGNIMFRCGIMAMFFNVMTFFVLFFMVLSIFIELGKKNEAYFIAAITGIFYLFSTSTFLQGLSAKGSVYTIQAFFISVIFLSLFKTKNNMKYLYLFSFIFGISLGNHWESSTVLLPAIIFSIYKDKKIISIKTWLKCFLFFLIGISIFIYIFIRSANHPVIAWGDIRDLKSFLWLISRNQYSLHEKMHTVFDTLKLFKYYFTSILPDQYPFFLAFLLIPGIILFALESPTYNSIFLIALIFSLIGIFSVSTNAQGLEFVIKQFLTFTYIFVAFYIAYFLCWLSDLPIIRQTRKQLLIGVSIFLFFLLYSNVSDYSNYFFVYDYSNNILTNLPEGCIYFAEGDVNIHSVLYKQIVDRNNVNVINVLLLQNDWYREQVKNNCKSIEIPPMGQDGINNLKDLMYANKNVGIYYSNAYTKSWLSYKFEPRGLVNKVLIDDFQSNSDPLLFYNRYSYRGLFNHSKKYDEFTQLFIFKHYEWSLVELGNTALLNNDLNRALFLFKRALLYFEDDNLMTNIAQLNFENNNYNEGKIYLNKALQINPTNPAARELYARLGSYPR